MKDSRDNRIFTDENGKQWLTNENGELLKDEKGNNIPPQNSKSYKSSGFTFFETSQGHCGLCGRLSCNGNCFK